MFNVISSLHLHVLKVLCLIEKRYFLLFKDLMQFRQEKTHDMDAK